MAANAEKSIMTKYKSCRNGNGPETLDSIDETDKEDDQTELGRTEEEGSRDRREDVGTKKRKKKHQERQVRSSGESGNEQETRNGNLDELKVILKFKEEGGIQKVSPIALTKDLRKLAGEIKLARVLKNGDLMIICKNEDQKRKVMGIKVICKKEVVSSGNGGQRQWASGVITGVPLDVSMDELKNNINGGQIVGARRLFMTREGSRMESLSVELRFDGDVLPDKVKLGFISYTVRPFVPPPLRCFNCQKYGHVAAVCKSRKRCARCGGEHDYGKCEGAGIRCCNCGGDHNVAFGGCEVRKRAIEVQNEKARKNITYAEAVKMVDSRNKEKVKVVQKEDGNEDNSELEGRIKEDTMVVSKVNFLLFIAEVINCTAQTEKKTTKIQIIVRAAERFLGVKDISWVKIRDGLVTESQSSQEAWCGSVG